MGQNIEWQQSLVDVQARLVPRFLWSTASIDVFLEGNCILRTGGQLKLKGSHSSTFLRSGSTHIAELSWEYGFLTHFPYKLSIDGTPIAKDRVYVRNWPLVFVSVVIYFITIFAILHFVLLGLHK
jgi:hypothetical protein